MAFVPTDTSQAAYPPMKLDPAAIGWLLGGLGASMAPNNKTVQGLAGVTTQMAKSQQFGKLLRQLLSGGVTPKGSPGLDSVSAAEDGTLTLKVPPHKDYSNVSWDMGAGGQPSQPSTLQPGFLASLFQE